MPASRHNVDMEYSELRRTVRDLGHFTALDRSLISGLGYWYSRWSSHLRAVASSSLGENISRSYLVVTKVASPRCPACRSECVRRSRRRGLVEKTLLTAAFGRPCRCVECGWRFFRPSFHSSFETRRAVFASRMTPRHEKPEEKSGG